MLSTGKRKGNLRYCHLAKFQKKEVSSQAGKKQNKTVLQKELSTGSLSEEEGKEKKKGKLSIQTQQQKTKELSSLSNNN